MYIAAFSGHDEHHQPQCPSDRKDKWSSALSLPCLMVVTVSYLDKPLWGVFHAFNRSKSTVISEIHGVLRDIQAHRVLAAYELN